MVFAMRATIEPSMTAKLEGPVAPDSKISEFVVARNPVIKRKREIKSCLECRKRKIKCDKSRPYCGSCIKFKRKCAFPHIEGDYPGYRTITSSNGICHEESHYETGEERISKRSTMNSLATSEDRLKSLETKIRQLEWELKKSKDLQHREVDGALNPEDTINIFETSIDMDRCTAGIPLSFVAIVKGDKYLNSMVECIDKDANAFLPMLQKLFVSATKLEEMQRKTGETWISKLLPYFEDKRLVHLLLKNFFKSELFQMALFLSESKMYCEFQKFVDTKSQGDFRSRAEEESLLVFLGTLLTVMRISSLMVNTLSLEIDADLEYIRAHPIEQQAMNLVMSCFTEVKDSLICTIELLQFALLLHNYRSFCPEYSGLSKTFEKVSLSYLHRLATILGLNSEPGTSTEEGDLRKRIWHHIVSIDLAQFARFGTSLTITPDMYTTELPQWDKGPILTIDHAILASLHENHALGQKLDNLPQLLANVRKLPSLEFIERKNDELAKHLGMKQLNEILCMDNSTVPAKIVKATKFFNFLDVFSCCFSLTYHIFLHYDKKNLNSKAVLYLTKLIKISNPMVRFLDYLNESDHFYSNVQLHFGYSFLFVFKILEVIQKVKLLSFSIIGRLTYYQKQFNTTQTNRILEQMKAVSTKSILLMNSYTTKASSYFYARRMNVIHTLITKKCTSMDVENAADNAYFQILNNSYSDFNDSFIPFVGFESTFEPIRSALLQIDCLKLDLSSKSSRTSTLKDRNSSVCVVTPTSITTNHSYLELLASIGDFEFGKTDFSQAQSLHNETPFATSFDGHQQFFQSDSFLY